MKLYRLLVVLVVVAAEDEEVTVLAHDEWSFGPIAPNDKNAICGGECFKRTLYIAVWFLLCHYKIRFFNDDQARQMLKYYLTLTLT